MVMVVVARPNCAQSLLMTSARMRAHVYRNNSSFTPCAALCAQALFCRKTLRMSFIVFAVEIWKKWPSVPAFLPFVFDSTILLFLLCKKYFLQKYVKRLWGKKCLFHISRECTTRRGVPCVNRATENNMLTTFALYLINIFQLPIKK